MERYFQMAKVNWKYNLRNHVIVAVIFILISPLIFGVSNLDKVHTGKLLEIYISLLGIILLVPIFKPYENRNIGDLIKSKRESMINLYLIGITQAIIILIIIITSYLFFLQSRFCEFPLIEYLYGTIATAIFLGGLGVFAYAIFDNIPIGYMIPFIYYIISFTGGKKYLGKLNLFSMIDGNIDYKGYLIITGVILIIISLLKDEIFLIICKKRTI